MANEHNVAIDPRLGKKDLGCPTEYAYIRLAERFGQDPLVWPRQHDAVAVYRFINLLGVEGEMNRELARSKDKRGQPVPLIMEGED